MPTSGDSASTFTSFLERARTWARGALRHVYPDRCPGCRVRLSPATAAKTGGWCEPCADTCFRLESPKCSICSAPRPAQVGRVYRGVDTACSRCREARPAFENADSLYEYTGAMADAIQFAKYAPASWPVRVLETAFRPWLARKIEAIDAPVLTTVPMHSRDLARRGYHLTEMLLALAARSDSRFATCRLLTKSRFTRPQAGLTLGERLGNVRGAFEVTRDCSIHERNVLLVDDVMTTGATAHSAAKTLMNAGANAVFVATIARAPGA